MSITFKLVMTTLQER